MFNPQFFGYDIPRLSGGGPNSFVFIVSIMSIQSIAPFAPLRLCALARVLDSSSAFICG